MTPEEKQTQLKQHRDILLATLDYFIERSDGKGYGGFNPIEHYQQLKEQTEEHYQKGRLAKLKQWLRDMTEAPREMEDFGFGRYIKDKTGYDFDIFAGFHKRIDKIIERKQIKTENQYRDVMSMMDHLCQQTPTDQQKIDLLGNLVVDFEDKISGTKTPKRKSSKKKKSFINDLFESYSPDNKRKLILYESVSDGTTGITQVMIEFGTSGGGGVYAANGINLSIKTYWKDNNTIVVETKKELLVLQKWEQVQDFQDIVKVEYIEE